MYGLYFPISNFWLVCLSQSSEYRPRRERGGERTLIMLRSWCRRGAQSRASIDIYSLDALVLEVKMQYQRTFRTPCEWPRSSLHSTQLLTQYNRVAHKFVAMQVLGERASTWIIQCLVDAHIRTWYVDAVPVTTHGHVTTLIKICREKNKHLKLSVVP